MNKSTLRKIAFFLWLFSIGGIMLFLPLKAPADKSNRFNRLLIMWISFTQIEKLRERIDWVNYQSHWNTICDATFKPRLFVPYAPWMELDVWEMLMKPGRFDERAK